MVAHRGRHWTFTIKNYTDVDEARLERLALSVSYLLFRGKVSSTGTPHLLGFVSFKSAKSVEQARKLLGGSGHLQCLSRAKANCIPSCSCCAERKQDIVLKTIKASRWYALYHSPMVGDPPTGGTQKRAPGAPACGAFLNQHPN